MQTHLNLGPPPGPGRCVTYSGPNFLANLTCKAAIFSSDQREKPVVEALDPGYAPCPDIQLASESMVLLPKGVAREGLMGCVGRKGCSGYMGNFCSYDSTRCFDRVMLLPLTAIE